MAPGAPDAAILAAIRKHIKIGNDYDHAPHLLAAIEDLSAALTRHREWFTDSKNLKRCGGCLEPSPCPDDPDMIVARALSGKDSSDGK